MNETIQVVDAPAVESPPSPGGLVLDKIDWDYSHNRPEPAFMASPNQPSSVVLPEAQEPASSPDLAETPPDSLQAAQQAPPVEEQPPNILADEQGNIWHDLGQTEIGMHKIVNPDGSHTRFVTPEYFAGLKPPESNEPAPEPPAPESSAAPASAEEAASDSEKDELRQQLEDLTQKVAKLEAAQAELLRRLDEKTTQETAASQPEPLDEISAFIKQRREINLAELDRQNSSRSARFHRAWEQARKSLKENASGAAAKTADFAKSTVQATSPYLKKAVEPIGVGVMYGQVLAENGPRLAGEAKSKVIEVVSEAGQQAAEKGKEPIGVGIAMAQIGGEKTAQAARDSLSRGVIAARMTGENVSSGMESVRSYRRRLVGRVLGAGAVLQSFFLWPEEPPAKTEEVDKNHGWNL